MKIVHGVSGSIAAFKAASLASDMVKEGYDVRTIMTRAGARFVGPLTFEALTGSPVAIEVWDELPNGGRMGHLELARWADLIVIAPASANVIARLSLGLTDDMLSAVALASDAPLLLAPAMETSMWRHAATQHHVAVLSSRGARFVGPDRGHLASGTEGEGRMAEPAVILNAIGEQVGHSRDMQGLQVLVTAGPTFEPIDPIRFIGNRSSGKMGYAIAEVARDRGATVVLVSGPTALPVPHGIELIRVETSGQMREVVLARVGTCDVAVMAAAVADFTPKYPAEQKIKRQEELILELEPTEDISAAISQRAPRAVNVGFALETNELLDAARAKLKRKGQQLVVANLVSSNHNPFGADHNVVTLVTESNIVELPQMSKRQVAESIWDHVLPLVSTRSVQEDGSN